MKLACVACEAALALDADACARCHAPYPRVGGVRVLATDGPRHVREHQQWLAATAATLREHARAARDRAPQTRRRAALERTAIGLDGNAGLLEELAAAIGPQPLAHALRPAIDRETYVGLFRNLIVDFARREDTEAVIATKLAAIRPLVASAPHETIVVAGCGSGRIADELAHQGSVLGVDFALAPLLAAQALRTRELVVFEPIEANLARVEEIYRPVHLPATPDPGAHRVLADALRLPVPSQSVDVVVADYFTDVVRPTQFVTEVRRVLKPGGMFVHFGPLGYSLVHDLGEMFTAEELAALLETSGFSPISASWHPHLYWPHPSFAQWTIRAWCSAWRRGEISARFS